jgi:P-type Cu+ transporter
MSFTNNVVTISIAAGLLYGLTNSLVLTPALAALGVGHKWFDGI